MRQEGDPYHPLDFASRIQNLLGTPEHIAAFVVNTLFNAMGTIYSEDVSIATVPKKMMEWFKAYR